MEKVSIFEYLKIKEDDNLFIKSVYLKKYIKILIEKYNSFIKEDNEKEYSLFLINKNSEINFAIVRFFILVKKFIGKEALLDIYNYYIDVLLMIRNFLIDNKIDETAETDYLLKEIRKKRNTLLLTSGDFKTEEILFSNILKEEKTQNKNEKKSENKITENIKKEENIRKEYDIKNGESGELIIYDNNKKILKRYEAYITVSDKEFFYIKDYIKENGKFYYLGKYNFGKKIKISYEFLNKNIFFKDILLKLIKKIKGEK